MTQYLPAFLVTWIALAIALYAEHATWRELPFLWRYTIGLGTFCGGLALFGLLVDDVLLVVVPPFLATAGLVIIGLYRNEGALAARERAGRRSGEIVGAARGLRHELTQEIIDRGGFRAESDLDGAGRQN